MSIASLGDEEEEGESEDSEGESEGEGEGESKEESGGDKEEGTAIPVTKVCGMAFLLCQVQFASNNAWYLRRRRRMKVS